MCDYLGNVNLIFARIFNLPQVISVAISHCGTQTHFHNIKHNICENGESFHNCLGLLSHRGQGISHPALGKGSLSVCTFLEGFLLLLTSKLTWTSIFLPVLFSVAFLWILIIKKEMETYQQIFAASPSNIIGVHWLALFNSQMSGPDGLCSCFSQ